MEGYIILGVSLIIALWVSHEVWHGHWHKSTPEETRAFKKEVEEFLAGIEEDEKRLMAEEEKKNGGEAKSS